MRRAALLLCLAVAAGCTSATRSVESLDLPEGTLRAGMSEEDAVAVLGPPDHRGAGAAACRYDQHFYDVRPVRGTTELAWRRPGHIVVAYLRGPIITSVGRLDSR